MSRGREPSSAEPAEFPGVRIGELAQRAGATTPTVRYYESIGLLPRPTRSNGQRRYSAADVQRVTFIRRCREFGFTIDDVRTLLGIVEDRKRPCSEAREIAQAHAEQVRTRIAELRALERTIIEFVQRCDESCSGGPGPSCVPLKSLAHARRGASARVSRETTRSGRASSLHQA